jgi:2-polyprenyl-6-methoxyphenol hydroxylase-like FAD-dependent oxidoreductase
MAGFRVGIVGGSIAGCAAAVALARSGHEVTVFERSPARLLSRGLGIATQAGVFGELVRRDMIGAGFPHRPYDGPIRWIVKHTAWEPLGYVASAVQSTAAGAVMAMHWGDLFDSLRSRVPDAAYRAGALVAAVVPGAAGAAVEVGGDRAHGFDLVICADGYRSPGRRALFPGIHPRYRGYVVWRGIFAGTVSIDHGFSRSLVRVGYPGGFGMFYEVPSPDSARRMNWALHLQVPENELSEFLGPGAGQTGASVAPDMMTPGRVADLRRFTRTSLPEAYAAIVEATPGTAIQTIYTVEVPGYSAGRVCLLGDAGSLFPPFTASGVFKAITNAIELAEDISGPDPLDQAVARWSARQVAAATAVSRTAAALEPAVIFGVPNLAAMDPADIEKWVSSLPNPSGPQIAQPARA